LLRRVVWQKFTDVSEVLAATTRRDDRAASTSETLQFYQTTWRNKLADSHFHTHHRKNLDLPHKLNTTQSTEDILQQLIGSVTIISPTIVSDVQ
jgi:hypothetical protein